MDIHDSVPSKVSTCENAMGLKKKKLKFLENTLYNREHGKCINFVVFHHKNYAFPVLPIVDRTIRKFVQSDTFVAYKTRLKPLELCFCMLHPKHPEHPLPSRISALSSVRGVLTERRFSSSELVRAN